MANNYSIALNTTLSVQEDATGDSVVSRLISYVKDLFAFSFQGIVAIGGTLGNPFTIPGFSVAGAPTYPYQIVYIKNLSSQPGLKVSVTLTNPGGQFANILLDAGDFIFISSGTLVVGEQLVQIQINPTASIGGQFSVNCEYFVAG